MYIDIDMKYIMHIYLYLAKNFLKYNRLRYFNFEICSILLPHDIVENLL